MAYLHEARLELRIKNAVLWHVIHDRFPSVAAFCRAHGFNQSQMGAWLTLKESPYRTRDGRRGRPINALGMAPQAVRIALLAEMAPEALFPPELYGTLQTGPIVAEVEARRILPLTAARAVAALETADANADREALLAQLKKGLEKLSPRQEFVIVQKFGLEDGIEHSSDEIGARLGVCRARVDQIQATALRKLRHPATARELAKFL